MALLSHHLLSGEPALAKIPSKNWAEASHPTFASNSQRAVDVSDGRSVTAVRRGRMPRLAPAAHAQPSARQHRRTSWSRE